MTSQVVPILSKSYTKMFWLLRLIYSMALSMHLYTISTQVPNVPEAVPYGTAVVLLGTVLLVNSTAIILRVYMRSRKRW